MAATTKYPHRSNAAAFTLSGEHIGDLLPGIAESYPYIRLQALLRGGGLGDHGVRYKKAFLIYLPVPRPTEELICSVEAVTQYLSAQHALTPEGIAYIEKVDR